MDASCGQLQEMAAHSSLESMLGCSKAANSQQERKPRPQPEQAQKCPRCDSTNTKFCYYNNYSLSQPRYFCKSCRRYWTKGGTLRNVPVGGGCRKNKRSSSSSSATSSTSSLSSKRSQDHQPLMITNTNSLTSFPHLMSYDTTNDLSLAFARLQQKQQNAGTQLGFDHDHDRDSSILGNSITSDTLGNPSTHFLDALRSGFLDTTNNFHNLYYGYGSGSNVVDQVDHHHHHDHHHHGVSEEMLMPFGDHHQMSGGTTTNATTTAVTVTTMKQESENNSNKVLWGFPWQLNSNPDHASSIINNHDLNSNWHGLLNNPLM